MRTNFLSQVRLTNWNRRYKHSRLRQRVDKADWRDHSYVPIVNAFYSSSRNAMIFPAGILQGLFFNHKVSPQDLKVENAFYFTLIYSSFYN